MSKRNLMPRDDNGNAIPVMCLSSPQDIDGTSASAQSAAIDGILVRICAIGGDIRFLIGADPTALATSNFLGDHQEIWVPIGVGQKVAVLGGIANIATAGVMTIAVAAMYAFEYIETQKT